MERPVKPRPQFATHAQVLAALAAEGVNWLAYKVTYKKATGEPAEFSKLTYEAALKRQASLLKDNVSKVVMVREVVCAGWPQLTYDELKKLPELPPTPESELKRIPDRELRKHALKMRREVAAQDEPEEEDEDT